MGVGKSSPLPHPPHDRVFGQGKRDRETRPDQTRPDQTRSIAGTCIILYDLNPTHRIGFNSPKDAQLCIGTYYSPTFPLLRSLHRAFPSLADDIIQTRSPQNKRNVKTPTRLGWATNPPSLLHLPCPSFVSAYQPSSRLLPRLVPPISLGPFQQLHLPPLFICALGYSFGEKRKRIQHTQDSSNSKPSQRANTSRAPLPAAAAAVSHIRTSAYICTYCRYCAFLYSPSHTQHAGACMYLPRRLGPFAKATRTRSTFSTARVWSSASLPALLFWALPLIPYQADANSVASPPATEFRGRSSQRGEPKHAQSRTFPSSRQVGWLAGWLACWLACLAGRLAGWLDLRKRLSSACLCTR